MNTYSHIIVASELETYLRPEDPQAYYWGAVAPDIRYLADMPRQQTHVPSAVIGEYMVQHPNLKAFLQGYLVHCLTDEIDLEAIFYRRFPLNFLKGRLSSRQITVLLELFYLQSVTLKKTLLSDYNLVLAELGIEEAQSARFGLVVTRYLSSPSLDSGISLAQELGMLSDSRIDTYLAAADQFQKSRVQKYGLFFSLRTSKIHEQIVASVMDKVAAWEMTLL